jgi:hypothetical protein
LHSQPRRNRKLSIAAAATAAALAAFPTILVAAQSNQRNRPLEQPGRKIDAHAKVAINEGEVNAQIVLLQGHAFSGQPVGFVVNFDITPGWHIYGKPLPEGYVPATVTFDNEFVIRPKAELPQTNAGKI